jgi:Rad3-related DNA helicase
MAWSLLDEKAVALWAKKFSNGKTQEDIANEVVNEIKRGTKIIFVHGVCGSGKSAIALNIAKELGRASIVVPIKNLQRQYEADYMHKKYVLKGNNEKLKISMITGRNNHICPYLKENKKEILLTKEKHERNSSLHDIFAGVGQKIEKRDIGKDESCDNPIIPCKIEIKSKNLSTLKKYYFENPERADNSGLDLKTAKRFAVAPACPYWSPLINTEKKIKGQWKKQEYSAVGGKYAMYSRQNGCPYYQQFNAYLDSDVIIFNGDQYLLETILGRKPLTDVEIIDECDEFLDNFAMEETINLTRLKNELNSLIVDEESQRKVTEGLSEEVLELLLESKEFMNVADNFTELGKSKACNLIKSFVKNDVDELISEDSYLEHCLEVSRKFYDLIDDVFISFYKDPIKNEIFVKFVTVKLEKLLNMLIEKNKSFVFMSGTLHSERVLKEIFGLKDFKIIDAETFNQGTIKKLRTGLEQDFKFDNFTTGKVSREQYLRALDKCVQIAKIPIVVQVSAFADLPNEAEIEKYNLKNLIASSQLMEQQKSDRDGKLVKDFKEGKNTILFTTRCSRGIDFPFETCNSVVITKFPYPNTQSLFWKILKKTKPEIFWDFYRDKAHRELLQRIYRSVRAADDSVFLLSPDIRVLNSSII